ncbi:MAG: 23S rRNA (adenine(2503)-C(2))-methyltransferase RlmN [Nitrospirae bacterium]|nr:MAG: 23S rRNA (adenine(2503)-C(2))-methyltransferase RlmN [Nitrospirota bacterium]
MRINLKALNDRELTEFVRTQGLERFRKEQLIHWIYERAVRDLQDITVFSKSLRSALSETAFISNIELLKTAHSTDGTRKFLFRLEDGLSVETVLIPDSSRLTLCVSSQVGCAMGCRFCLTGRVGFRRNLLPHEIVDQILAVQRLITPRRITNIVFMGMGEPLKNLDNVAEALRRITTWMGISKRRITLSTSGVVDGLMRLKGLASSVNIAISLNATTNSVRDFLMPINRVYPIEELLKACRHYPLEPRRRITFEYILIKGINDTQEDAKRLARLLRGIRAKINLIPFNPFQGAEFERPDMERVLRFQNILIERGYTVIIRKSKGDDISAACGQLRGEYELQVSNL